DMLAASSTLLTKLRVQRSDKLFVFGFSQGSHAALALHRQLEEAHVDVTGTATVGNIFDVEQWFLSLLARDNTNTLPLYAAYIVLAYDDVYNVYERTSDVFRQPYASTVAGPFHLPHFLGGVLPGAAPDPPPP